MTLPGKLGVLEALYELRDERPLPSARRIAQRFGYSVTWVEKCCYQLCRELLVVQSADAVQRFSITPKGMLRVRIAEYVRADLSAGAK